MHDVGTGSGAVALALLDERPDLRVSASDSSAAAVDLARDNAHRLGAEIEIARVEGLPPGEYDLVVANLPYVREDEWAGLEPEITRYEPRGALVSGADGLDAIREPGGRGARRARRWRWSTRPDQGPAVRALLRGRRDPPRPGRPRARDAGHGAVTPEEVATFERCISVGGVALFPADTVYGLATEPDSREGVDRLYRLKGRPPAQPAAVMFFRLDLALEALPELGRAHAGRGGAAAARARSRCVLPNPARRFPLACGPDARPAGAAGAGARG